MYINKIDEKIEESAISTAAAEMMEVKGRKLWEEYGKMDKSFPTAPDEKHRAEFEAALDRAYRRERIKTFFKGLIKPAKYAVTSLAALIVIFSFSVVSVDAVRIKFIDWLMSFHNSHTVTRAISEYDTSFNYNAHWQDTKSPVFIPNGYKFKSSIVENDITTTLFENNDYYISIQEYPIEQTINADTEDAEYVNYVEINGYDAILVRKKETLSITWHIDNHSLVVFTNDLTIDINDFMDIARSID